MSDPNAQFHVPADQFGNAEQTYTRQELADELGLNVKWFSDETSQRVANVFAANIDGTEKFDFNDCEEEMKDDLRDYIMEQVAKKPV